MIEYRHHEPPRLIDLLLLAFALRVHATIYPDDWIGYGLIAFVLVTSFVEWGWRRFRGRPSEEPQP